MLNIHKEVFKVLAFLIPICIIITLLVYRNSSSRYKNLIISILSVLSVFCVSFTLFFFRNPQRVVNFHPNGIISPADGTVVIIKKVFENEYFKDDKIQVSIFMSPLNVHVNRSPIDGVLKYYKYYEGKYFIASLEKSSEMNEHNTSVVQRKDGTEIMFRQIAGFLARRIAYFKKVNESLKQGEEIGMIKFGSRVDLLLPLD
ncbi:MAG: phosphatidylserine decarboxylase family protein, partial [Cytophagales bacterium]|nr:phosphatidylserine decarboxylase family protein [Cytophagales bacterium]